MNPENDSELQQLIARLLDEQASDPDLARLEILLHGDPEACETYLDQLTLHAQLQRECTGKVADEGSIIPHPELVKRRLMDRFGMRRFATVARYASVAAAAFLLAFLIRRVGRSPQAPVAPDPVIAAFAPRADYIATLVSSHDAVWGDPDPGRFDGQRLLPGGLHLKRGMAELHFDSGATVVMQGPAKMDLMTVGRAFLKEGNASVYAPQEAYGFTLQTAGREFVDLGTEFAVKVDHAGATEVQVQEGQVESHYRAASGLRPPQLLEAGQAMRYDTADGASGQSIAVSSPRVQDLIAAVRSSPGQGRLLAYEPFAYPTGTMPAMSAAGGFGWAMPWRGRYIKDDTQDPGATLTFDAARNLAAPTGHLPAGGGLLQLPLRNWRIRKLQTPIDLGSDGVYYISYLCKRISSQKHAAAIESGITLRCEAHYWDYWMGFSYMGDGTPSIIGDGGTNSRASTVLAPDRPYLFVGKILAGAKRPDQLFLKVYGPDDVVDTTEPARWTVSGLTFDDNVKLDLLILSSRGNDHEFDEIRVGTSWSAVTGDRRQDHATAFGGSVARAEVK